MEEPSAASCLDERLLAAEEIITGSVPYTIAHGDRATASLLALLLLETQHVAASRASASSLSQISVPAVSTTSGAAAQREHKYQVHLLSSPAAAEASAGARSLWVWKVEGLGIAAVFLGREELDAAWLSPASATDAQQAGTFRGSSGDSITRTAMLDAACQRVEGVLGREANASLFFAGHGSGGALAQAAFVRLLGTGSPALVAALLAGGLHTFGALLGLTKGDLTAYAMVDTPDRFSAAEMLEVVIHKAKKRAGNGTGASTLPSVHQFVAPLDVYPRLLGDACRHHGAALDALASTSVHLRKALQPSLGSYCHSFEPVGTYHLLLKGGVRSANCSSHPELCKLLLEQPLASLGGCLSDAVLCGQAASQATVQHGLAAYQQALSAARREVLAPQLFMGGSPDDYEVVYGWPHRQASMQPVGFLQHRPSGAIAYNALVPSQSHTLMPSALHQASSSHATGLKQKLFGGIVQGAAEEAGKQVVVQAMQAVLGQTAQQASFSLVNTAGGAAINIAGGTLLGGLGALLPIANTALGFLNLGASIYTAINTRTIKKKMKHVEQELQVIMEQNKGLAQGMGAVLHNQEQLARMTHAGLLHLDARFGQLDNMLGQGLAALQGQMQRMELGIQDQLQGLGTQLGTGLLHLDNKLSVLGVGLKLALDDHSRLLQCLMTGVAAAQQEGFTLLHQELANIGRTLQALPEAMSLQMEYNTLKTDWRALQDLFLSTLEVLDTQDGPRSEVRMDAALLKGKAIEVRARAAELLESGPLRRAENSGELLKRLPLLELIAISGAMLDVAQSVLLNKEEYLNNRLKATSMIDEELQQWITLSTLYSVATSHQEAFLRLVCLRRAMLEPAQLTVSLCQASSAGQQAQLHSAVAYNMQDLVWDDGLELIRQLLARPEPVAEDERLPAEIVISDLQLAAAYAAFKGKQSWGNSMPRVSTATLLEMLGVPRERKAAVMQRLRKSDAASLMVAASPGFQKLVLETMARQLPGSTILADMAARGSSSSKGRTAFQGARRSVPLQRSASLTKPNPAMRNEASPAFILEWQAHEAQLVATTWLHASGTNTGSCGTSGRLLATASKGPSGSIRIWSLPDTLATAGAAMAEPQHLEGPPVADVASGSSVSTLRCLAWQPSTDATPALLALGGEGRAAPATAVELWQQEDQCWMQRQKKLRFKATVNRCAWSPDGQLLAVLTDEGIVSVWDVANRARVNAAKWAEQGDGERGFSLSWSGDGKLLAWGAAGGRVFFNVVGSSTVAVLQCEDEAVVSAVAWSPAHGSHKGRLLVTGGHDGTLRVWDLSAGLPQAGQAPVMVLQQHTARVRAVAWRPSRLQQLASVASDGMVLLWDAGSWKVVAEQQLAEGWVTSMSWSPDGKMLAVGKRNGRVSGLLFS